MGRTYQFYFHLRKVFPCIKMVDLGDRWIPSRKIDKNISIHRSVIAKQGTAAINQVQNSETGKISSSRSQVLTISIIYLPSSSICSPSNQITKVYFFYWCLTGPRHFSNSRKQPNQLFFQECTGKCGGQDSSNHRL